MRVKLQLVICHDEGHEETITDVIALNKNHQRIEHLGLTLAESKQLLSTIQRHLLQQQVNTFLDARSTCPDCGTPLKLKAHGSRSFRTLLGTFQFYSPRLEHCDCKRRKTSSFRPLSALLTASVAPELLYMEAKWSSLVSYGMSLDALQDFLPLDVALDVKTVRYDTLKGLLPTGTLDFSFLIRYIRRLTSTNGLALDCGGRHDVSTAQTSQSLSRRLPEPPPRDGVA
jgi:hypothetical protein